ncbi:MAG: hypothetical protein H6837_07305 [Planctomycetes bacterium]|nr:hypothetical protein [Planctomycetota bacterium]
MLNRFIRVVALAIPALVAGCNSSGGSASGVSADCGTGTGGNSFCLVSCSLGCSVGGCQVTDIAANQPIKLVFSQDVDPSLVNFNTISIKTAAGKAPEGRFEVNGRVVEFIPGVRISGGTTTFGFARNETYVLTLPDSSKSGLVLRSTSGDSLASTLSCALRVSRGIVDLDQAPPRARLVSPSVTADVKADAVIIVEFSEIIDITPFQGSTTQTSPVEYLIRKTMAKPGGKPNERICDPNFNPQILEGLPEAENISGPGLAFTRVTLRPSVPLPSQICVEVNITNRISDLAGTAAEPQTFSFTTEILAVGEIEIAERFASDSQLDKQASSGIWSGGKALPPVIGGSGVLGPFQLLMGKGDPSDPNHYIFNTESHLIDKAYTPTGQDITVTGGVFEFSEFTLPTGFRISFEGANPAQIRVRGTCVIEGKIEANAPDASYFLAHDGSAVTALGQKGSLGGCGGAAGGDGGNSCPNAGASTNYDGKPGNDVGLPAGHGYAAQAVGTGGKGSLHWPRSGTLVSTDYCALNNTFSGTTAGGGGGGGFHQVGSIGGVTRTPCQITAHAGNSNNTGGGNFPLGTFAPKTSGPTSAIDHFGVGGSGGGGGGSHGLLVLSSNTRWPAGSAGAGGGGVLIIRCGQDFTMGGSAVLQAIGGSGYRIDSVNNRPGESRDNLFNVPSPGGGGSGGSIVLQVFGRPLLGGLLDTSGGKGGILDNTPGGQPGLVAKATGGDGSPGYVRLETPGGPSVVDVGSSVPAAASTNIGMLTDHEFTGVSQSRFYASRLTFPPTFLRYEVEAYVDTGAGLVRKLYSDDSEVGNPSSPYYDKDFAGMASSTEPVHFELQGAKVSAVNGQPDLTTLGPWREAAASKTSRSLNDDKATGYRFRMTFDQDSGKTKIEVRRVSVFFIE